MFLPSWDFINLQYVRNMGGRRFGKLQEALDSSLPVIVSQRIKGYGSSSSFVHQYFGFKSVPCFTRFHASIEEKHRTFYAIFSGDKRIFYLDIDQYGDCKYKMSEFEDGIRELVNSFVADIKLKGAQMEGVIELKEGWEHSFSVWTNQRMDMIVFLLAPVSKICVWNTFCGVRQKQGCSNGEGKQT